MMNRLDEAIAAPEIRKRLEEKYTTFTEKGNNRDCWIWKGYKTKPKRKNDSKKEVKGYGVVRINSNYRTTAHRLAYALYRGSVSSDLEVCHTCDNPPCVNPSHLFLGSKIENRKDCTKKGRNGHKLLPKQVKEIWALLGAKENQYRIAETYGVSQATVSSISRQQTWKYLTSKL